MAAPKGGSMSDQLMDATIELAAKLADEHAELTDNAFADLLARVGADFAARQAGRLSDAYLQKVIERFVTAAWTARAGVGRPVLN
jgi:hypothetical protein